MINYLHVRHAKISPILSSRFLELMYDGNPGNKIILEDDDYMTKENFDNILSFRPNICHPHVSCECMGLCSNTYR